MLKIFNKSERDFKVQFKNFKELSQKSPQRFLIKWEDRYPCLNDRTQTTEFDRHYVYHPAWAARILAAIRPAEHIDISSCLQFCSIVSAFLPVRFYDFRPATLKLDNLTCEAADLLSLPFADKSIMSLSCMHVVEHIGLGRYGDQFDPNGDLKAIDELKRVLAVTGSLLFVVPVGKPRIMFNAHRIYSYEQIREYFIDLELVEFTLIPDHPAQGGMLQHAESKDVSRQSYACGCFWFRRR